MNFRPELILTFKNFLLSLHADFSCIFQLDRFPFIYITQFGFAAYFSQWLRMWITSCSRVDLKEFKIQGRVIHFKRNEKLFCLTFGGLIGVFDWAVVVRLAGRVSSSSSSLGPSTSLSLSIDLSSIDSIFQATSSCCAGVFWLVR